MLINELNSMLEDLSKHHRSRETLLKSYIIDRLNASVESYYHDLLISFNYLKEKDALKLAKKMNKED